MRIISLALAVCCLLMLTTSSWGRRVQIGSRVAEPSARQQQVYYEDEEEEYSSSAVEEPIYQPRTRALHSPRSKDTLNPSKVPPVQTIRNYNKVNDDGSFTFGYEAADGSFKEETRGTDCVVRGKYGYVDPDGNKREFTYVSGNPCDPNALREEDDDDELLPGEKGRNNDDEIGGPANYPSIRPVARPTVARPNYRTSPAVSHTRQSTTTVRPPTTIFQNDYRLEDDATEDEPEVELIPVKVQEHRAPIRRPQPNHLQYNTSPAPPVTSSLYQNAVTTPATPRARIATTASTRLVPNRTDRPHSVAITPRPLVPHQYVSAATSGATTERPGVVYANRPSGLSQQRYNLAAQQLERYVNTVGINAPTSPRPTSNAIPTTGIKEGIYGSTELVYDPQTGRYSSQIYRQPPTQSAGLRPQLKPQQSSIYGQQPQNLVAGPPARPQEAIYRQQQAELLAQSQQLYAQQQRRQQQPPTPQRYQLLESRDDPHAYYYVQAPSGAAPSAAGNGGPLSVGQIDQFLRGSTAGF